MPISSYDGYWSLKDNNDTFTELTGSNKKCSQGREYLWSPSGVKAHWHPTQSNQLESTGYGGYIKQHEFLTWCGGNGSGPCPYFITSGGTGSCPVNEYAGTKFSTTFSSTIKAVMIVIESGGGSNVSAFVDFGRPDTGNVVRKITNAPVGTYWINANDANYTFFHFKNDYTGPPNRFKVSNMVFYFDI